MMGRQWMIFCGFVGLVVLIVVLLVWRTIQQHESLIRQCIDDGQKEYACRGIGPKT